MAAQKQLDPLREFLDDVVTRIETLEAHCGLSSTAKTSGGPTLQKTPSVKHLTGAGMSLGFKQRSRRFICLRWVSQFGQHFSLCLRFMPPQAIPLL